jgi:hypothetical protein
VGVPTVTTVRLGEMTQPVRVITSVAPAREAKTAFSRDSFLRIT